MERWRDGSPEEPHSKTSSPSPSSSRGTSATRTRPAQTPPGRCPNQMTLQGQGRFAVRDNGAGGTRGFNRTKRWRTPHHKKNRSCASEQGAAEEVVRKAKHDRASSRVEEPNRENPDQAGESRRDRVGLALRSTRQRRNRQTASPAWSVACLIPGHYESRGFGEMIIGSCDPAAGKSRSTRRLARLRFWVLTLD